MTSTQILDVIQKLKTINEGQYGHCGNFAVALNRILNNIGKFWVVDDDIESEARFYHVVLKVSHKYYDADGIKTKKEIMDYYTSNENGDDPLTYVFYEVSPENEYLILNGSTDDGNEDVVKDILNKFYKNFPEYSQLNP